MSNVLVHPWLDFKLSVSDNSPLPKKPPRRLGQPRADWYHPDFALCVQSACLHSDHFPQIKVNSGNNWTHSNSDVFKWCREERRLQPNRMIVKDRLVNLTCATGCTGIGSVEEEGRSRNVLGGEAGRLLLAASLRLLSQLAIKQWSTVLHT